MCASSLLNISGLKTRLTKNQTILVDCFSIETDCDSRFFTQSIAFGGPILVIPQNGIHVSFGRCVRENLNETVSVAIRRPIGDADRDKKSSAIFGFATLSFLKNFLVSLNFEGFTRPIFARKYELSSVYSIFSSKFGPIARRIQFISYECSMQFSGIILIMSNNRDYVSPERNVSGRSFPVVF